MAVRFALRSRIVLRAEPERARAIRLPPLALPVAAYWAIMGLLTYGVASGALRPERFASFHPFPRGSFESGRLGPGRPSNADDGEAAPRRVPPADVAPPLPATSEPLAAHPATPEPVATTTTAATDVPPMAGSEPDVGVGPVAPERALAGAEPRAATKPAPSTVRPLAGFALTSPYAGDRYADEGDSSARLEDTTGPSRGPLASRDPDDSTEKRSYGRLSRRDPDDIGTEGPHRTTRDKDPPLLVPDAFQPAARRPLAFRAPKGAARVEPQAPWFPDVTDDDAPSARLPTPRARPTERPTDNEPVRAPAAAPASIGSCEAVAATANDVVDMTAARGTPDVTRGAYASLLERGGYLVPCHVPDGMVLDVCAAVRDGRAVGITVVTRPADARVGACVRNAVAALPFPRSPRLDVTRTRFDAARRK